MHCAKELTVSDVKSPPAWSTPHSIRKFLLPEVIVVPFEAGQETSFGAVCTTTSFAPQTPLFTGAPRLDLR